MSSRQQSGTSAFRPRARLMKLIGEELISDNVVALVELVKNAYDADATKVTIAFNCVTQSGGTITVTDNGHGMSRETLLERWMQPASAWKKRQDARTKKGRRFLGEKGVGRFAADKLASRLEILSRCPRSSEEVLASVDWDRFDDHESLLSDVRCRWRVQPSTTKNWHGTTLTLSRLRSAWNERMFQRLSTRLARLVSPFDDVADFRIAITSDEFPEYGGELQADFLERAPHWIRARFDGRDRVEVRTGRSRHRKYTWNGGGNLSCGPVQIQVHAFDLDALSDVGPVLAVRSWLQQWTGLSIYRDGFRVWPYGEPHNDWLRLDQRRVNNPVVRLSNNQLVGFVQISHDGNPSLRDQTNREGMIQNRGFEDLRRLAYFVLQILEAERQRVRHPAPGASTKVPVSTRNNGSAWHELEALSKKVDGSFKTDLERICRKLDESRSDESRRLQRLMDEYINLAAVAQLPGAFKVACQPPLDGVRLACETLETRLGGGETRSVRSELKKLRKSVDILGSRMDLLSMVEGQGQRRRRTIDVATELKRFRTFMDPFLLEKDVRLKTKVDSAGVVRAEMRPEVFLRLLYILAANSLDWIDGASRREILIEAGAANGRCEVAFSDTGPGIPKQLRDQIFEPFFSAKDNGAGLGLTVARRLVTAHGGEIKVGRSRTGARIELSLPRKRSRTTLHRD